jgi:hypothetical protein
MMTKIRIMGANWISSEVLEVAPPACAKASVMNIQTTPSTAAAAAGPKRRGL